MSPRNRWALLFTRKPSESLVLQDLHEETITLASSDAQIRLFRENDIVLFQADRSSAAVLAGELDNVEELVDLFLPGGERKNYAELVLSLYNKFGTDCLTRLKGVFSLVIWDGKKQKLVCVRDPVGVQPLFWSRSDQGVWVSPFMSLLVENGCCSRKLNRLLLAEHLCDWWVDPEDTYFESVTRVPPGHYVEVDAHSHRSRRYWDPAPPGLPVPWASGNVEEQFTELFSKTVSRYLQQGQAGIFLSGGLDSISVAAVAVEEARRQDLPIPLALSVLFEGSPVDNGAIQSDVASYLGMTPLFLSFDNAIGRQGMLSRALQTNRTWSVPLMNSWLPAFMSLAAAAKSKGCNAILTGGGGDEWLVVGPFFAADCIRRGDLGALVKYFGVTRRSFQMEFWHLLRDLLWRFGLRAILSDQANSLAVTYTPSRYKAVKIKRQAATIPAWVAPDSALRRRMVERILERREADRKLRSQYKSFYIFEARRSLDHPLISMQMEETFEMGHHVGLRFLQPFWDSEMVNLLYRVPPQVLNQGESSKGLLRKFLQQRLRLDHVLSQKKMILSDLYNTQMADEAPAAWGELGSINALEQLGVARNDLWNRAYHEILTGKRGLYNIWNVFSLETWARSHS
jgi:asparagine synthetase B (glutamine-hydrolysing)